MEIWWLSLNANQDLRGRRRMSHCEKEANCTGLFEAVLCDIWAIFRVTLTHQREHTHTHTHTWLCSRLKTVTMHFYGDNSLQKCRFGKTVFQAELIERITRRKDKRDAAKHRHKPRVAS